MSLTFSLAHLLGGVILLCGFLQLSQRRLAAMITLYQTEALVLAAAAFWQGFAQHELALYLTGLITLALKGVLLPWGLREIVLRFNMVRAVETALPMAVSMILGLALIGIAVLVVLPTTMNSVSLTREDLAIALSVVLLGLLLMIVRRNALAQIIGFLSLENGLVLAAIGMPGMPFVAEFSVALLVLLAFLVVGVFLLRIREHFDTLDLSGLEEIERRGAVNFALLAIAFPFLAAILLGLAGGPRQGAIANAAASAVVFALTLAVFRGQGAGLVAADPLACLFGAVSGFVGFTAALVNIGYVSAGAARMPARRWRLYHALYQIVLGASLLGLYADNAGLLWAALEGGTIAMTFAVSLYRSPTGLEAAWKYFILGGVGIGLALFGTMLVYLAAQPAWGRGWRR